MSSSRVLSLQLAIIIKVKNKTLPHSLPSMILMLSICLFLRHKNIYRGAIKQKSISYPKIPNDSSLHDRFQVFIANNN
jgi:hypothetical protein